MNKNLNKLLSASIAASVLAGTATTSFALPVASNNQAVSEAVPANTTDVRWRHHHRRWVGPAVGLGILGLGIAAATAPRYYDGYYGPGYGAYYDPYYGNCFRDRWGRVLCR